MNGSSARQQTHEPRSIERHVQRLDGITTARERARVLRRQGVRGAEAQRPERDMEASLRRRALAMLVVGRRRGLRRAAVARAMGLAPDMLACWQQEHDRRCLCSVEGPAESTCLGRPPLPEPPALVRDMCHVCHVFGPGLGVRSLHDDFPDASWRTCLALTMDSRRELRDQLREARALTCIWTTPGTVWATDVWKPEAPIESEFRYVLDVRDLASGFMVASEPLEQATADTVGGVLDRLYGQFGPPLVCKTDNGSEFLGAGSWEVHHYHGVEQLLSPVELPSYNGACEAGHGSIRYRAERLARRDGRPGDWSLNHLAGARDWANDLVEARRPISASRRFEGRPRIGRQQRLDFRQAVLANKQRRCAALRRKAAEGQQCLSISSPSITRPAIAVALRDLGYLNHRSVPIRQHIPWL